MSRVSKFAARDPGPAARVAGFIAHLRQNGLRLGVAEAELALLASARSMPLSRMKAVARYGPSAQDARMRPNSSTASSIVFGWIPVG